MFPTKIKRSWLDRCSESASLSVSLPDVSRRRAPRWACPVWDYVSTGCKAVHLFNRLPPLAAVTKAWACSPLSGVRGLVLTVRAPAGRVSLNVTRRTTCVLAIDAARERGKKTTFLIIRRLWSRDAEDENIQSLTWATFSSWSFINAPPPEAEKDQTLKHLAYFRELVTLFLFLQSTGCCLPASGTLVCEAVFLFVTRVCFHWCLHISRGSGSEGCR